MQEKAFFLWRRGEWGWKRGLLSVLISMCYRISILIKVSENDLMGCFFIL